jgi:HAD superfamily phosphatase
MREIKKYAIESDEHSEINKIEGVLFDMDGVLVDVSKSYRLAIKKTIEYFLQEEIELSLIQDYKNKGGYNNDWDLTMAIISNHGRRVEREDLIKCFQRFYLGNNFNGFVRNETWLLDNDVLAKLKKKYRLAIVTGRTRKSAIYGLRRFNKESFFDVLIVMEDVPEGKNKPNPYGLTLAMKKLNIKQAVYLGDNIDDIKAAIATDIIPIGVINESASKKEQMKLMKKNGARFVLENVNEILEVLK